MSLKDGDGFDHEVKFFQNAESLLNAIPTEAPVFLDIDLDFFITEETVNLGEDKAIPKADEEIESMLARKGPLMDKLWDRTVGLTIALEPTYCGGFHRSLHILEIVNQQLFHGGLWAGA